MFTTHYLEWRHNGRWHRIGWDASTPKACADLRTHAKRLAKAGGCYRIVVDSPFLNAPVEVVESFGDATHAAPYCPQAEWLAHTRSALRDEAADYRPRHLRESEAVTA